MDFEAVVLVANSKDFDDAMKNLLKAGYVIKIIAGKDNE